MKYEFYALFGAIAALVLLSSCKDPITDSNAGTFTITNLSTGETIKNEAQYGFYGINSSTGTSIAKGDTLEVKFTPKSLYRNVKFSRSCSNIKQISDSYYVVDDLSKKDFEKVDGHVTSNVDTTSIDFMATYNGEIDGENYDLSARQHVKVNRMSTK